MTRQPRDCEFRRRIRQIVGGEIAECGLLQMITGATASDLHTVRRDACESCCRSFPPGIGELNPVVASLLYDVASRIVENGGMPGCDAAKAAALQLLAERNLSLRWLPPPGIPACDVVLCCEESSSLVDRAVLSALEQQEAQVFLHLVNDGGGGSEVVRRYAGLSHVFTYSNPTRRGALRTLHDLVPRLRTAYVALQDPGTVSLPRRIRYSVGMLETFGGEFLAAPMETPDGLTLPAKPRAPYRRYLPPQTLVFRRASFVDMGGIMERPGDADAELIYRAFREGRKILLSEMPTVVAPRFLDPGELGPSPPYQDRVGTVRQRGIGFPQESVACDVVLPFRGHLEYVGESLPSVLEQDGAETVVHLIDDATPGGAEQLLRYWGSHPRVRTYRNRRNLGQFVSFNNVFPYLETDLIAIQDADDVSLPQRVRLAGNHLRLTDADIFGGRFETFEYEGTRQGGDGAGKRWSHTQRDIPPYWASEYPRRYERSHFLQNTTAVLRKSIFEALRGFSDYGDVDRNKCGLDTEFFVRAHHAGCRFALTNDVVVRYRWHSESVTRNSETGWGTQPRDWSTAENERRFKLFHRGPFDPRVFGSLHHSWGQTQRIK